jgi:hypothetical protein
MNKTGMIAAGAFVVLLAVFFGLRGNGEVKSGVASLSLPTFVRDELERVDVAYAKDASTNVKVTLRKDGSKWQVEDTGSDKHFDVEENQVKSLLDAVAELQAGDRIANQATQHKDLEIEDAQAVTVTITAKGKPTTVLFGRPAKSGGSTVRLKDQADVFIAKGRLGTVAKKDTNGWRRKSMVDVKADDFRTVTMQHRDGETLVLEAKQETPAAANADEPPPPPKTTWSLTTPATLPAGFRLDTPSLSRVASSLSTLRAADFADGVSAADAGLGDTKHGIIKGTTKDGKDVVVHLGKEDDKKRVYAQVDGDKQIYLVASFNATAIERKLDDLRDLTLGSGDVADVKRAIFHTGKTKIVVDKDAAGTWKLTEPKTPPAEFDAAQINTAVQSALKLRAARYLGAADAKLINGDTDISFVDAAGKTTQIRFGAAVPDAAAKPDDKPKEFYVRGTDGNMYVINAFQKTRYEKPADLFKKPPAPPQGMPGMGGPGAMNGLDSLPPDVRKKLEESMRRGGP